MRTHIRENTPLNINKFRNSFYNYSRLGVPAGGSVVQSEIYQMYFYRFLFLVVLSTSTLSVAISNAMADEFQSNLAQIGVTESLQNQFNNGSGVVVGVIDGLAYVFHPEFESRYINLWVDTGGTYNSFDDHATHVSGIIGAARDGTGMVGVAPGVSLTNIALFDDFGPTTLTVDDIIFALRFDGASIVNMSFGPIKARDFVSKDVLKGIAEVRNEMLAAVAAGNDGGKLRNEKWKKANKTLTNLIIVGSVDSNNELSSFSNYPGKACFKHKGICKGKLKKFFMVAPGENILSTGFSADYLIGTGTSMATPHVAGAAALLQSRWSFLKNEPKTTRSILFDSAQDLGKRGIDKKYGRGLLRVDQAVLPLGATSIQTGIYIGESGSSLSASRLVAPAAFGNIEEARRALKGTVFFDGYGRDFKLNVEPLILSTPTTPSLSQHLDALLQLTNQHIQEMEVALTNNLTLQAQLQQTTTLYDGDPWSFEVVQEDVPYFMSRLTGHYSDETYYVVGTGYGFSSDFHIGFEETAFQYDTASFFFTAPSSYDQPILSMANGGFYAHFSTKIGNDIGIKFGLGQNSLEDTVIGTDTDVHAFAIQVNSRLTENLSLSLTQAYLHEQGSTLGGVSEGAFKLSDVTETIGLTATIKVDLPASIRGELHYTEAMTTLDPATGSLFSDFSTLNSRALGLSLLRNDVLTQDDRLGISISRPLRVYSGTTHIKTPIGRTNNGDIIYDQQHVSMAPSGEQTDYEISYERPLLMPGSTSGSMGLTLFHIEDADHVDNQRDNGFMMTINIPLQ